MFKVLIDGAASKKCWPQENNLCQVLRGQNQKIRLTSSPVVSAETAKIVQGEGWVTVSIDAVVGCLGMSAGCNSALMALFICLCCAPVYTCVCGSFFIGMSVSGKTSQKNKSLIISKKGQELVCIARIKMWPMMSCNAISEFAMKSASIM